LWGYRSALSTIGRYGHAPPPQEVESYAHHPRFFTSHGDGYCLTPHGPNHCLSAFIGQPGLLLVGVPARALGRLAAHAADHTNSAPAPSRATFTRGSPPRAHFCYGDARRDSDGQSDKRDLGQSDALQNGSADVCVFSYAVVLMRRYVADRGEVTETIHQPSRAGSAAIVAGALRGITDRCAVARHGCAGALRYLRLLRYRPGGRTASFRAYVVSDPRAFCVGRQAPSEPIVGSFAGAFGCDVRPVAIPGGQRGRPLESGSHLVPRLGRRSYRTAARHLSLFPADAAGRWVLSTQSLPVRTMRRPYLLSVRVRPLTMVSSTADEAFGFSRWRRHSNDCCVGDLDRAAANAIFRLHPAPTRYYRSVKLFPCPPRRLACCERPSWLALALCRRHRHAGLSRLQPPFCGQ